MKHTSLSLYLLALLLSLLVSCDASILQETPPGGEAHGQPIEINIGPYPTDWEGTEPGTRTAINPDNNLKTDWVKGDKLWIWMRDISGSTILATGTATYDGQTWSHNLCWPVGVTAANFYANYIGNHKPGSELFTDTDMLISDCTLFYRQPVDFRNFHHCANRLIITGKSLDGFYLSGEGFRKWGLDADYNLIDKTLFGEYLPLSDTSITVYLSIELGSHQLYKKEADSYTFISDLNFSSGAYGHTYTLDLDAEGTITPEAMNKAQERARFLAWAEACNRGTYQDFTLEYDIDLTGVDWMPVKLEGRTFDGNNHTITGLNVTRPNENSAGLFGYVYSTIIRNLHVSGTIDVSDSDFNGGIVGVANGCTLENISFSGNVKGRMNAGGIAGYIVATSPFLCHYRKGTVTGNYETTDLFGLIDSYPAVACKSHNDSKSLNDLNAEIDRYNTDLDPNDSDYCHWRWEIDANGDLKATKD